MPERVVFIHVQYAGNTYLRQFRTGRCGGEAILEEKPVLYIVYVFAFHGVYAFIGEYGFAFVARVIGVAVLEGIAAYGAVVFAPFALCEASGKVGIAEIVG